MCSCIWVDFLGNNHQMIEFSLAWSFSCIIIPISAVNNCMWLVLRDKCKDAKITFDCFCLLFSNVNNADCASAPTTNHTLEAWRLSKLHKMQIYFSASDKEDQIIIIYTSWNSIISEYHKKRKQLVQRFFEFFEWLLP